MLSRFQRGIEQLYRVDTRVAVDDFVIDADARAALGVARQPREQLLVSQSGDDELELGLFVDERALANLERHDPSALLDHRNLDDFLLTVEGVSHFVYVVWRAQADRPVSALELELQAEVDKYVTTLLTMERVGQVPDELASQLFGDVEFANDLDAEEQRRYRVANENARRYSESLHRRFVRTRRIDSLLGEVREFYRLTLDAKLAWIREAR